MLDPLQSIVNVLGVRRCCRGRHEERVRLGNRLYWCWGVVYDGGGFNGDGG